MDEDITRSLSTPLKEFRQKTRINSLGSYSYCYFACFPQGVLFIEFRVAKFELPSSSFELPSFLADQFIG